jgi:hypothetical protein
LKILGDHDQVEVISQARATIQSVRQDDIEANWNTKELTIFQSLQTGAVALERPLLEGRSGATPKRVLLGV